MKICSVCQRCYDDAAALCVEGDHAELTHLRDGGVDLIDGYHLDSLVESRPFVQTFKAHQKQSGVACRVRIVKVDRAAADDFLREAKIGSTVFHKNLAGIYDSGSIADEVFVVSEECDGRTLRDVLTDGRKPELLTTIAIIRQVSEALHVVHKAGLVHGAVRPENIVLTGPAGDDVQIKLRGIDAGGAVRHSLLSNKLLIESALDMLRYFSPEHFDEGTLDAQADIYSLGVVFYEMLCGAPPFDASTATGLMHLHRHEVPAPIKINDYNLRMLVTHAMTEALQKQSRLRQSSANALVRQLRHIEQLSTHSSTPPPAGVASASRVTPRPVLQPKPTVIEKPAAARPERFVDTVGVSIEEWVETKSVEAVVEPAPLSLAPALTEPPVAEDLSNAGEVRQQGSPRESRAATWKKKLQRITSDVATKLAEARSMLALTGSRDDAVSVIPKTPKKIQWEQPVDDIPSVTDVANALAADESVAKATPSAVPMKIEIPAPIVETKPIATPVADAKVAVTVDEQNEKPEIRTVSVPKPATNATVVRSRKKKPAVAQRQVAPSLPIVVRPDPDEITLVRTPRRSRIRIDIDRVRTKPRRPEPEFVPTIIGGGWTKKTTAEPLVLESATRRTAAEFVPTIIGGRKPKAPVPTARRSEKPTPTTGLSDAMFSAYYDGARTSSVPYRSLAIVSGIVTLTALFLFGTDSASKLFQAMSPGDSVTAGATSTTGTPQVEERISVDRPNVRRKSVPPSVDNSVKPTSSKPKRENEAAKSPVKIERPNAKNGTSKKPKVEEKKRAVASPPARNSPATRPRIVADPQ